MGRADLVHAGLPWTRVDARASEGARPCSRRTRAASGSWMTSRPWQQLPRVGSGPGALPRDAVLVEDGPPERHRNSWRQSLGKPTGAARQRIAYLLRASAWTQDCDHRHGDGRWSSSAWATPSSACKAHESCNGRSLAFRRRGRRTWRRARRRRRRRRAGGGAAGAECRLPAHRRVAASAERRRVAGAEGRSGGGRHPPWRLQSHADDRRPRFRADVQRASTTCGSTSNRFWVLGSGVQRFVCLGSRWRCPLKRKASSFRRAGHCGLSRPVRAGTGADILPFRSRRKRCRTA